MARTPRDLTPTPEVPLPPASEALLQRSEQARTELDVQRMTAERLERYGPVFQQLGRIQAFQFMATVSHSAIAQTFADVRRSKAYRGLPYTDTDGQARQIETLEEFCQLFLGKSYRHCTELADNLHTLGPELYERSQEVGWKTKDYRSLRALPEDEQVAVREALESEDRDQALTVLSELVARQRQGREAAERRSEHSERAHAELKENYEAASTLLGDRERELHRLKSGKVAPPSLDERWADWGTRVHAAAEKAYQALCDIELLIGEAAHTEPPELDAPEQERESFAAAMKVIWTATDLRASQLENTLGNIRYQLMHGVETKWRAFAPESLEANDPDQPWTDGRAH